MVAKYGNVDIQKTDPRAFGAEWGLEMMDTLLALYAIRADDDSVIAFSSKLLARTTALEQIDPQSCVDLYLGRVPKPSERQEKLNLEFGRLVDPIIPSIITTGSAGILRTIATSDEYKALPVDMTFRNFNLIKVR